MTVIGVLFCSEGRSDTIAENVSYSDGAEATEASQKAETTGGSITQTTENPTQSTATTEATTNSLSTGAVIVTTEKSKSTRTGAAVTTATTMTIDPEPSQNGESTASTSEETDGSSQSTEETTTTSSQAGVRVSGKLLTAIRLTYSNGDVVRQFIPSGNSSVKIIGDGGVSYSATTDMNGGFTFHNVAPGHYVFYYGSCALKSFDCADADVSIGSVRFDIEEHKK